MENESFSFKVIIPRSLLTLRIRRVVMQPTHRFTKTLLAGALLLGTGNTFYASAQEFTITASGIPDVIAAPVDGFTTLGFGSTIKGGVIGGKCKIRGLSAIKDSYVEYDLNGDASDTDAGATDFFGSVTGTACNDDASGTASGSAMIIEIDGVANATVAINIDNVVGAGFTYRPSAESCIMTYEGGDAADTCAALTTGSATGIKMAAAHATEVVAAGSPTDYGAEGTTRMILAGEITIDAPGIGQGVPVSESVVVTITYE
jgi:hypothetical protein